MKANHTLALAVSALVLPGSILVAAGAYRLASALGGPGAGTWAPRETARKEPKASRR